MLLTYLKAMSCSSFPKRPSIAELVKKDDVSIF